MSSHYGSSYGGSSYGGSSYGGGSSSYGSSSYGGHGGSSSGYGGYSNSNGGGSSSASSGPPISAEKYEELTAVGSNGSSLYGDLKQPSGTAEASSKSIDFDQYDDIPVETSGRDSPSPILTWDESKLHPNLLKNIADAGYTKPTPVQKYSIPIVANKRDLMSCAQTGSGKTAAFLLPIMSHMIKSKMDERGGSGYGRGPALPTALVIAPTRELAIQINDEARKFLMRSGLKSVVVYGGSPMGLQLRDLERGADLIVATPGRLVDILEKGKISLTKIQFLVLDEADRMLDMGFEPQIRRIVEKENMPRRGIRQTLMFSATFPKEIQQMAASFLDDYIFLTIGRVGSATELITQKFLQVERESDRDTQLVDLCHQSKGLTLIFVETKRKANNLDYQLRRVGLGCTSIHGDRSQAERVQALRSFSSGQTPILIATNVAARGLDIGGVTHVINYEMPNNIDDYVHRIGRTGRAGKHGVSTSFVSAQDTAVIGPLVQRLQEAGSEVPAWLETMRINSRYSSGKSRGGRGGDKFGGRDFRKDHGGGGRNNNHGNHGNSSNYGGNSYGGYGGSYNAAPPAPTAYPGYPPATSAPAPGAYGGYNNGGGYSGYGGYSAAPPPSSSYAAPSNGGYGGYGGSSYGPPPPSSSSNSTYGPVPPTSGGPSYSVPLPPSSNGGSKRDRDDSSYSDNKKPRYDDRDDRNRR